MTIVNSQTHGNFHVNSVRVYGIRCEPTEIGYNEIIKNIESDLSDAENGDTVRMVAGELDCGIYNKAGVSFKKYHEEKDLRYEILAGPVISGCPESMIVNLAAEGIVDFYLAPVRRRLHYRLIEDRILCGEIPHSPLVSNRLGYVIDVGEFGPEEKESASFAIRRKIKEFEAAKIFSTQIAPDKIKERVVVLPKEQILRIQQELFS